jgi:hypothetical protein
MGSLQVLVGLRTRKASGWIFLTLQRVGFMNKNFQSSSSSSGIMILHMEFTLHVSVGPSSSKLYVVQNPLAEAFPK